MEYFNLYSSTGDQLNKLAFRGERLNPGEFFLVVHMWIENSNGEFLIQQRAKKNDPTPFQWAITSGIPNENEGPLDAVVRETNEELGITLDKNKVEKRAVIVSSHNEYNTITHVYYTKSDIDLASCVLDSKEVQAVDYQPMSTIISMAQDGLFWDYSKLLDDAQYFDYIKEKSL